MCTDYVQFDTGVGFKLAHVHASVDGVALKSAAVKQYVSRTLEVDRLATDRGLTHDRVAHPAEW